MAGQPGSENRQMTAALPVRFTPVDLAAVKQRAEERRAGVAAFVRAAALDRPLLGRKTLSAEVARAAWRCGPCWWSTAAAARSCAVSGAAVASSCAWRSLT